MLQEACQRRVRGVSEACQRRVVRGVSEACQRRIIWIKLHSVAMPTALPKGRYRCSEEDIVGTPCAPPWTSAENEPKLNGLKISCPCIGIGNAGVAFQQAGWGYEIVNSCDVEKNLEAALKATEGGSLKGIDLGAEDGNLLNKPMSSLVPSHALLAGPPCPPWANNGNKQPGWDARTKVFCRVIEWVIYLANSGCMIYVLLENVKGITHKMQQCPTSFLDKIMEILQLRCPQFAWRHDILNARDYLLPHSRNRCIIQGALRILMPDGKVPPPLDPMGERPLYECLKPGLPHTDRLTLTKAMQKNMKDYEKLILHDRESGTLQHDAVVVCEMDRAFGKTYNSRYTVNAIPCLKTSLAYLFAFSVWDIEKEDSMRTISRWIMPWERLPLQGRDPRLALQMTTKQILTATGNAYPVNMIGACIGPVFRAIAASPEGAAAIANLPDSVQTEGIDIPNVTEDILQALQETTSEVKKRPAARSTMQKRSAANKSTPATKMKPAVLKGRLALELRRRYSTKKYLIVTITTIKNTYHHHHRQRHHHRTLAGTTAATSSRTSCRGAAGHRGRRAPGSGTDAGCGTDRRG